MVEWLYYWSRSNFLCNYIKCCGVAMTEESGDIIDSMLNEDTLKMLDNHSATIDKLDGILSKVDSIMSKPIISDVFDVIRQKIAGKTEEVLTDPWDCMIGGVEVTPIPPRPQPQQQIAATSSGERSELHSEMHAAIEQMSEEEIMELLGNGSQPESTGDTDTEHNTEDGRGTSSKGSGEEHPSGTDGKAPEL